MTLGRALTRFDSALFDRPVPPTAPVTRPGVPQPATWEARFLALRAEHAAGATALAEPPEHLDWLPAATGAAVHSGQQHPRGAVVRLGAAARRASAWNERASESGGVFGAIANAFAGFVEGIERVVFQRPADSGGVFGAIANTFARLAERLERVVFQPVDTGALKLAGIIAGITDAVERAVFQSGVERGLASAGAGAQRLLLATEQRLGQPLVIGSILALALAALIVGTL